jgi:DNA-binding GntR family transcriptional regulator
MVVYNPEHEGLPPCRRLAYRVALGTIRLHQADEIAMADTQPRPSRRPRTHKASEIAERLIALVQNGTYAPGERLREQDLAERFNISRGPIREALRLLEARAVVRIEPMRGATVSRLSDKEVREAVEISAVLFGLSVRNAAGNLTSEQIEQCRRRWERLKQIYENDGNHHDFFQQTVRIGAVIVTYDGITRLGLMLGDVRVGAPNMYGGLCFLSQELRRSALEKWARLIDAVERGDGDAGEVLAREIHHDALQAALKVMGQASA